MSCCSSFHSFTSFSSPFSFHFLTFGCLGRPLLQPSQITMIMNNCTNTSQQTSGQKILTRGRIAGGQFFTGDYSDIGQWGAIQSTAAVLLMSLLIFLLHTPQLWLMVHFSGPDPQKLPIHLGWSGLHLIYSSLGPPKSILQLASQLVQPFLQVSWSWPQTQRQNTILQL